MEGKKKYFALVLFLFLGLMIFTFANPDEERLESQSGNNATATPGVEPSTQTPSSTQTTPDVTDNSSEGTVDNGTTTPSLSQTRPIVSARPNETNENNNSNTSSSNNNVTDNTNNNTTNDDTTNNNGNSDNKNDDNKPADEEKKPEDSNNNDNKTDENENNKPDDEEKKPEDSNNNDNKTDENENNKPDDEEKKPEDSNNNDNKTDENENNKPDEKEPEEEKNDSYEKALAAVVTAEKSLLKEDSKIAEELVALVKNEEQKEELTNRLNKVFAAISAIELVEILENMVTTSKDKEALNLARNYRTEKDVDNVVNALEMEELKLSLQNRIDVLKKLLDDESDPVINGLDKEITNEDVSLTITDENEITIKVTLNGKEIDFKETFTEEGKYVVEVTDAAFNKKEVSFEIEKTSPVVVVTKSNNDKSTNQNVVVTLVADEAIYKPEGWTEVTTNKEHEFTKTYEENGKYSVIITDKAGNQTEIKFEVKRIDKVAPVITVVDPNRYFLEAGSEYVEKGYSSYDVVDKDVTNLVKISYLFQAKGSNEWKTVDTLDTTKLGTYKITYTAYDKAGNTSKGTRVVAIQDTINPLIKNYPESGFTDQDFKIEVEDVTLESITISKRGENEVKTVENGYVITEEGSYIIEAKDKAGNTTRVNLGVDKTAPIVTGIEDGKIYNTSVTPVVTDLQLAGAIRLNGAKFASGTEITEEGDYVLEAADRVGHTTTVKFSIDKTAPKLVKVQVWNKDNASNNYVKNGSTIRVLATFTEELYKMPIVTFGSYTAEMKSIGEGIYSADITIKETEAELLQGLLAFKITGYQDKAGNTGAVIDETAAKQNVIYDRTAPTIAVKNDSIGTKGHYSFLNLKLHDNIALEKAIVNGKEYSRTSNWNDLNFQNVNNYVVGENTVQLFDKAGNETTFKFVYDVTKPSYNFVGIMNIDQVTEGYAKVGDRVWVYVVVNEYLSVEPEIRINGTKARIVQTEDGAKFNDTWYKYVGEVVMTEAMAEGNISFTISGYKDLAGNSGDTLINANINKGLKAIILDKQKPVITVKSNSTGSEGHYKNINFGLYDNYLLLKATVNDKVYSRTTQWNDLNFQNVNNYVEGKNTVTLMDRAGNTSSYTFILDRVAPQPVSTTYSTTKLTNGNVVVTIRVNEELRSVEGWTLSSDKKAISKEFTENINGNVTISDLAGNTAVRYYSIKNIDKVAPTAKVVVSNETRNDNGKSVEFTFSEAIDPAIIPQGMYKVAGKENTYTKVYYKSGSLTVKDLAGNLATFSFEI